MKRYITISILLWLSFSAQSMLRRVIVASRFVSPVADDVHALHRALTTLKTRVAELERKLRAEIARRAQRPGVHVDPVYAAFKEACKNS